MLDPGIEGFSQPLQLLLLQAERRLPFQKPVGGGGGAFGDAVWDDPFFGTLFSAFRVLRPPPEPVCRNTRSASAKLAR